MRCKKYAILSSLMIVCMLLSGCSMFETVSSMQSTSEISFSDINKLQNGKAYVWSHEGVSDIKEDLTKLPDRDVFFECIKGDYTFEGSELDETFDKPRTIWMDSTTDQDIPTVVGDAKLIYLSETQVPDTIVFERFADYGYTIGVANMLSDLGDHYYIVYADMDEDDYKYSIDMKSDAASLVCFDTISKLYLDKVGNMQVNHNTVSEGGTVIGLKKDQFYNCEFYTGTYYQDFKLQANIHTFGSMERFISYDYSFVHSNCIVINIPEFLKSGYYFVNGVGLFRYVSEGDAEVYKKDPGTPDIDWNDPIIQYDENGFVIYDPNPDLGYTGIEDSSDPGVLEEELVNPSINDQADSDVREEVTD